MNGPHVHADKATMKGAGLVRNAQGQPQFDDFNNIPEIFHSVLSEEDWEYIRQQRGEEDGVNTSDNGT